MKKVVDVQRSGSPIVFSTHGANVLPLTGMFAHVVLEVLFANERLLAYST